MKKRPYGATKLKNWHFMVMKMMQDAANLLIAIENTFNKNYPNLPPLRKNKRKSK